MSLGAFAAAVVISSLAAQPSDRLETDLRARYSTPSYEAAQKLARVLDLEKAGDNVRALQEVDEALKLDPKCSFAAFHRAQLLRDLGRIEEAAELFKKVVADGKRTCHLRNSVAAEAMMALGMLCSQLDKFDEGNAWWTEAILYREGPPDLAARAYRNLAVNRFKQGHRFAAAIAAGWGQTLNAEVVERQLIVEVSKGSRNEDVAPILRFEYQAPKIPPRAAQPLTPVKLDADIAQSAIQMMPDPQGRYVVILVEEVRGYYLATTAAEVRIQKVDFGAEIGCGCLVDGKLYLVPLGKSKLHEVAPDSGRILHTYSLGPHTTYSIAVFPRQHMAYFSKVLARQCSIYRLNLESGEIARTPVDGHEVVGDPDQQFLYSIVRAPSGIDEWRLGVGTLGIRERLSLSGDRNASALFRSVVLRDDLVLSDVLDRVGRGGDRVIVSPDGYWLAVAGRSGWIPNDPPEGVRPGPGLPVFHAHDLTRLEGFYPMRLSPKGAAFNPVTGQVVLAGERTFEVVQLGEAQKAQTVAAACNGACAWSGDGAYLLLGKGKGGLLAYRNPLSDDEKKIAATWWQRLAAPAADSPAPATTWPMRTAEPLPEMKTFQTKSQRTDVQAALSRALRDRRTDAPVAWSELDDYVRDNNALHVFAVAQKALAKDDQRSGAVTLLRETLRDSAPGSPLLHNLLAGALANDGRRDEAEEAFLAAIRGDAGRTSVTIEALGGLHDLLLASGKRIPAAYCLAEALCLDCINPGVLKRAMPLLTENGFAAESRLLEENKRRFPMGEATATLVAGGKLPRLPPAPAAGEEKPAKSIYAEAVPSVALVKAKQRSGTAFCVAKDGYLLTALDVVGDDDAVDVFPFDCREGKPVRLAKMSARVVFRSEKQNLAVLRVSDAPATLAPLPVAATNAEGGVKVYAIGNPGQGEGLLEQTLSQGIVSHALRESEGKSYLQHTAAVSPGHCGGPLLDSRGCVVGLIVLTGDFESVGFAVPAAEIRKVFAGQ